MKKLGQFEIPVFKFGVMVYKGLPDDKPKNQAGFCETVFEEQTVRLYYNKLEPNYIVHEIVHAADFILYAIGADMGTSSADSEVRAYLVDFITKKVFDLLKKKGETK